MVEKRFTLANMILKEGALEILELSKDNVAKQFANFKDLKNSRTGKYFSQTTISDRLKDMIEVKALEKVITKSKLQKDVVGYRITERGLKILETAYDFEEKLEKIIRK